MFFIGAFCVKNAIEYRLVLLWMLPLGEKMLIDHDGKKYRIERQHNQVVFHCDDQDNQQSTYVFVHEIPARGYCRVLQMLN